MNHEANCHYSLHIIPFFVKQIFHTVGPMVLSIINLSKVSGYIPSTFMQAEIQLFIQKPNLDPTVLSNSQNKSQKYLSCPRSWKKLCKHNILDKYQSSFKMDHSAESALLRATNDLLLSGDSENHAILIFIYLIQLTIPYSWSVSNM